MRRNLVLVLTSFMILLTAYAEETVSRAFYIGGDYPTSINMLSVDLAEAEKTDDYHVFYRAIGDRNYSLSVVDNSGTGSSVDIVGNASGSIPVSGGVSDEKTLMVVSK